MATFNNSESGSSVRTKINEAIDKVDGVTPFGNNIDVTGTITSDGLTVDGDAATFNSVNANAIVIQRGGGSDLNTAIHFNQTAADTYLGTDSGNSLVVGRALNLALSRTAKFDQNGDISFYEDTGTTPKFFWDASAESLGIGTSSPLRPLHVASAGATYITSHNTTSGTSAAILIGAETSSAAIYSWTAPTTGVGVPLRFLPGPSEAMRITPTGNVGIGTSSPTNLLDVNADSIRVRTAQTPATAGAAGNQGEIAWDADYIYVCVATNTWKRAALSTW